MFPKGSGDVCGSTGGWVVVTSLGIIAAKLDIKIVVLVISGESPEPFIFALSGVFSVTQIQTFCYNKDHIILQKLILISSYCIMQMCPQEHDKLLLSSQ